MAARGGRRETCSAKQTARGTVALPLKISAQNFFEARKG
jgi:hypothetical protein